MNNSEPLLVQARAAFDSGDYATSEHLLESFIQRTPGHASALASLTYVKFLLAKFDAALQVGAAAVNADPMSPDAHLNFANALRATKQVEQAIDHLRQALSIRPSMAEALTQLNLCFLDLGKPVDAVEVGLQAIAANPGLPHGWSNYGLALQVSGRAEDAHEVFSEAIGRFPDSIFLHSNRLMNLQYVNRVNSQASRRAAHEYHKAVVETVNPAQAPKVRRDKRLVGSAQLTLGFVGADFRQHPVGWFLTGVLESMQTIESVKVMVFANQTAVDAVTTRMIASVDDWHDIASLDDQMAAALIEQCEIDVLIDLSGHTAGNRLGVFALRPAPIQISWLGYFGTTGAAIDYVMMSIDQLAEGAGRFFTEQLLTLTGPQFCYTPPEYAPALATAPCLKVGSITYGCFNNLAKVNPDVLDCWSTLLRSAQQSRLILKWSSLSDARMRANLLAQFESRGVDPSRIELRGASDHADMLAEYADIDIALDPFPFSGALTSIEALWMGVPVVTMAQSRPVSRQTAGLLKRLGLASLSTQTPAEYVRTALALSEDRAGLIELRASLRSTILTSELSDHKSAAQEICETLAGVVNDLD